jgi:PAS domain S-box-containing protein
VAAGPPPTLYGYPLRDAAAPNLPPAAVVVADRNGQILHVEGTSFDQHGDDARSWAGKTIADVLPPDTLPELQARFQSALGGETQSFDYTTADGSASCWVQLAPLRDAQNEVSAVVAITHDLTERLRVAAELARSEARLRESERMVGVGSWELMLATNEITFSSGFARLIGLAPGESLDAAGHRQRVIPEDAHVLAQARDECLREGSVSAEYRIRRPDGDTRTLIMSAERVDHGDGHPVYMRGAVLDVTDERQAERERLAAESIFRVGFDAAPVGMALTDPSEGRYLRVNDALCRLLQRPREELLTRSVSDVTHPEDRGADETLRHDVLLGLRSGVQREKRYLRPDGSEVWASVHMTPVHGPNGEVQAFHSQVLDISGLREREARMEGEMSDALWLARIRDALDQERFLLHAQPIVDLVTGETVQQELLLRMRDEDGSVIPPGEFLPVAERYGVIGEIDRWVIRESVRIAAAGTPAEFNLSARSISDPGILSELGTAIEACGTDPSLLVVEVTETAILDRIEASRAFAEGVRELGCRLALDDFGTGFGSLSHLKHIPADHLKIDMEFVRELSRSETDQRVVRGIVGFAREFHQTTIAEGVEDEATLLLLKELGVDQAQGYLLGRPAPLPSGTEAYPTPRPPQCDSACDALAIVREAFEAYANGDLAGMIERTTPDVVLRPAATAELTGRPEPYIGHGGLREYLADVSSVWDRLGLTPLTFRQAQGCVIAFGHTDARRGSYRIQDSVLCVVRLAGDKIASLEVFQDNHGSSRTQVQLEELKKRTASRHPAPRERSRRSRRKQTRT